MERRQEATLSLFPSRAQTYVSQSLKGSDTRLNFTLMSFLDLAPTKEHAQQSMLRANAKVGCRHVVP